MLCAVGSFPHLRQRRAATIRSTDPTDGTDLNKVEQVELYSNETCPWIRDSYPSDAIFHGGRIATRPDASQRRRTDKIAKPIENEWAIRQSVRCRILCERPIIVSLTSA